MLLAHLRAAQREAPAPGFVDQLPRLAAIGVLEGRSAGLAPQRLAGFAARRDAVHFSLYGLRLSGGTTKPRRNDNRAFGQLRMAIGVVEIGERQRDKAAIAQHHIAVDQHILDLAAIGPAVHPHKAANGAGDRAQELQPGNA